MWNQWRNWAERHATSFFQSVEWAETLTRHYPFYRPEPIVTDSFFLPLIRHRRWGWISDSLYGMPLMSTGGLLTGEKETTSLWMEVADQLTRRVAGTMVLCLPCYQTPPGNLEGFDQWQETTHLIDLSGGWETVYERFNKSCKEAIRRAQRLGVAVEREEDERGIEAHWKLIQTQFAKWKPNPSIDIDFIRDLVGLPQSRLYVARQEGCPLLSLLAFVGGGEIFLWQSAKVEEGFAPGTSNLLTCQLLQEACEEGLTTLNYGASLGSPRLESYKESYGAVKESFTILKRVHPLIARVR